MLYSDLSPKELVNFSVRVMSVGGDDPSGESDRDTHVSCPAATSAFDMGRTRTTTRTFSSSPFGFIFLRVALVEKTTKF